MNGNKIDLDPEVREVAFYSATAEEGPGSSVVIEEGDAHARNCSSRAMTRPDRLCSGTLYAVGEAPFEEETCRVAPRSGGKMAMCAFCLLQKPLVVLHKDDGLSLRPSIRSAAYPLVALRIS